jgi:hypothetical protein
LGAGQLGLVAGQGALRLQEVHLELARIDLRQRLAGPDHLAFLEQHLGDHARHLRPDGDRRGRGHRAERLYDHRQIGLAGRGDRHGAGRTTTSSAAATTRTAAGTARSTGCILRRVHQAPGQPHHAGQYRQGDRAADDLRLAADGTDR